MELSRMFQCKKRKKKENYFLWCNTDYVPRKTFSQTVNITNEMSKKHFLEGRLCNQFGSISERKLQLKVSCNAMQWRATAVQHLLTRLTEAGQMVYNQFNPPPLQKKANFSHNLMLIVQANCESNPCCSPITCRSTSTSALSSLSSLSSSYSLSHIIVNWLNPLCSWSSL